jgi:hypothetical protein
MKIFQGAGAPFGRWQKMTAGLAGSPRSRLRSAWKGLKVAIMKAKDILLLGLKSRVTAISQIDGNQIWSTEIPVRLGGDFVTLICDGAKVFAYSSGRLHCLDLGTGSILWSNTLPGLGYGLATLCLPNSTSNPNTAAVQVMMDSQTAAHMAATSGSLP